MELFNETTNNFLCLDQIITGGDHVVLDYRAALQRSASSAPGNKVGNPGPVPFWRMGAGCSAAAFEFADDNSFDFTRNLSRYTTKVLFLYGELDVAYGRLHAELVSSAYHNVQLVGVKSSGHEIPYFGWEEFYEVSKLLPQLT